MGSRLPLAALLALLSQSCFLGSAIGIGSLSVGSLKLHLQAGGVFLPLLLLFLQGLERPFSLLILTVPGLGGFAGSKME